MSKKKGKKNGGLKLPKVLVLNIPPNFRAPQQGSMAEAMIAEFFVQLLDEEPPLHEVYQTVLDLVIMGFELSVQKEAKDPNIQNIILAAVDELRDYLRICTKPPLASVPYMDEGPWPGGHPENNL